jgi:trehalose/maltose transport system substrate-binding protein
MRRAMIGPAVLAGLLMLTSCGGPAGAGGTGDGSGQTAPAASLSGQGPITFVTGADTSGYLRPLLDNWNHAYPQQRVTLVQLPADADDQHAQMVANLQARSGLYDVLNIDVIWTPEFASAGWIVPLNTDQFPLGRFLPPAVDTAVWDGRLWAVPYTSNAGLLYYRKDILARAGVAPPRTWAQLAGLATAVAPRYHMDGYAGQYMLYEGLTVNFTEAVQSAGGAVLSGDGKHVALDSPQAREGLNFLVQGFRQGWIPRAALGWDENKASAAFEAGRLLFMRNWPLAYGLASRPGPGNKVVGRFGVVPLPGPAGRGSSSLGGGDLAISAFSRHQRTALQFIKYLTSLPNERQILIDGSLPPVWTQLYSDRALIRSFPYLPVLKQAILSAKPRPMAASYNQLSLAISSSVYQALNQALTLRKPAGETITNETITNLSAQLGNIIRNG